MSDTKNTTVALTKGVVMTFPNLHEAKAFGAKGKESGTPKFSANFLFTPDSPDLKALKAQAAAVARAKWPNRELKELAFPFSNGDKAADKAKAKGKDREFERGHVVVAGRSKFEPILSIIENRKVQELEGAARVASKSKFYAGATVLAEFNFVAYDGVGANPDGVTAYLNKVALVADIKSPRLGGTGASSAEVFKSYVGTASDEDPTAGQELGDEIQF